MTANLRGRLQKKVFLRWDTQLKNHPNNPFEILHTPFVYVLWGSVWCWLSIIPAVVLYFIIIIIIIISLSLNHFLSKISHCICYCSATQKTSTASLSQRETLARAIGILLQAIVTCTHCRLRLIITFIKRVESNLSFFHLLIIN